MTTIGSAIPRDLSTQSERTGWGWRDIPSDASVTLRRLADQINFFDKRSKQNQIWYRWLKTLSLIAAVMITLSGSLELPRWAAPLLGAVVVVLESYLVLTSRHRNWLEYRSTCEALKHEKYLYLGGAGPYRDQTAPETMLAERVEDLLRSDHSKWLSTRKEEPKLPVSSPK
jgi:hypothetical protein